MNWLLLAFRILVAITPILSGLAVHNYNVPVNKDAGVAKASVVRPLFTHGMLLASAATGFGALVVHHKLTGKAGAAIPDTLVAQPDDLPNLFKLFWQKMGPGATQAQVKAIQDLQEAMKTPKGAE